MDGSPGLGVNSICCALHSMLAGGSTRQWLHLLERHVARGGRATIIAPPGPLSPRARAAGIEVVDHSWDDAGPESARDLRTTLADHDAAIVHWDHQVMAAFAPALEAGCRTALVVHQPPDGLARWFGPQIMETARVPIIQAVVDPRAVVLVRGEWHRRAVADRFDVPAGALHVLPASIPLDPPAFDPVTSEPGEVLAMVRLSPEKASVVMLAAELVRARLRAGHACRLVVAGEGGSRDDVVALCERRLEPESWRIEAAPDDPLQRLAAAQLVVAQGLTTLEAAALGRRVVVARFAGAGTVAGGAPLTPRNFHAAASDPFGQPYITADVARLWDELPAIGDDDLRELRALIEQHNSLDVATAALRDAFAAIA